MKYLKYFENKNRMPRECEYEEIMDKLNIHKPERFTKEELEYLEEFSKNFKQKQIFDNAALLYNGKIKKGSEIPSRKTIINKLQDDWFTVHVYGPDILPEKCYICDEFIELKNYLNYETSENI